MRISLFLNSFKVLKTIETHTGGQPTRVVIQGLPKFSGDSVLEKRKCAQKQFDYIRKFLCCEPRGHSAMYAAYILESDVADFGVIFCSQVGYDDMCGHGTIGVVTALFEEGFMSFKEEVSIETPAGVVFAKVSKKADRICSISFRCVTSFLYQKNVIINVPGVGSICGDIAFGGNWYYYVNADSLGFKISLENLPKFLEIGAVIKETWNRMNALKHPSDSNISQELLGVSFFSNIGQSSTLIRQKNLVVESNLFFDRSPCGTGTAGRMAILNAEEKLPVNMLFENFSITGSVFTGTVISRVRVGSFLGVESTLTGSASIVGRAEWSFDQNDVIGFKGIQL